MNDFLSGIFLLWFIASSFYGTGILILNIYHRYERRKDMNIDFLDEDGASNIKNGLDVSKQTSKFDSQ